MIITGFEKFTLLEYPGKLSALIFTYGCTLRCPFCHNPELVICPVKHMRKYNPEEIIQFMKSRIGKLQALAITGGEPTIQQGLIPFMRKIKDMGFLIKLDTYGLDPDRVQEIMDTRLVDYWAMDIKGDINTYRKCGYQLDNLDAVNKSIKIIKNQALDYEFRTTMLKGEGWHTREVLDSIAKAIKGAKNYYIQNFRAGKNIDKKFTNKYSFTHTELTQLQQLFAPVVSYVGVRA